MRAIDVITRAFRRLGVVGVDDPVQAHDAASARAVLEGLVREMRTTEGISLPFSMDTIPSRFVEPLALLLAAEIASDYSAQPPVPRVTAIIRLRAASYPPSASHRGGCYDDDYCDDYGHPQSHCPPDAEVSQVIVQQGGAFQYENRAEVQARTVPAEVKVIRVHGRQSAGYGGAWYRRVGTSTHPFKLVDMSGAIFEPTGDPASISALVPPGEAVTIGEGGDFPDIQTAADLLWAYSADRMVELRIVSPPKKGWLIRAEGFYRLTSAIGPVVLPSDFEGVSNTYMEGFGANTMASTYRSDKNFIVGMGVRAPQIGCVIDMNSPRGSNRLGNGIHIQHGSIYIEGGCGFKRAGLVGVMAQNCDLWAIAALVEASGCENWRVQQASKVTLQQAISRGGLAEFANIGGSTSGSSTFISRASSANLAEMEVSGSLNDGIELHGVNARMTEAEFTGNT